MFPQLSSFLSGGAGGLSVSDSTKVTFDPYADLRKTINSTNNFGVGGGTDFSALVLPLVIIAAVVIIAWKLLK